MWQAYVDGPSNCWGAGVEIVLVSPKGIKVEQSFKLGFQASNNKAEYKALLVGLRMAKLAGAQRLKLQCHSSLVVS